MWGSRTYMMRAEAKELIKERTVKTFNAIMLAVLLRIKRLTKNNKEREWPNNLYKKRVVRSQAAGVPKVLYWHWCQSLQHPHESLGVAHLAVR
jgi:hypothetical protein